MENNKETTGKGLSTSLYINLAQVIVVKNIRCRKTAHPKASTPCPPRFEVNLLRRILLGFKKTTYG